MLRVAVLISGSGSNLRALLEAQAAYSDSYRVVGVLSDKDASGLEHAREFDVPTTIVAPADYTDRASWGDGLVEAIEAYQPDLVVGAGFMRIIPPNAVAALFPRLINTHPSLLPNFPGAHAVRDALAAGATETGVTVHIIDEGVDTGPIIEQRSLAVLPGEPEADLHERIKTIERELLASVVDGIAVGRISLDDIAAARRGTNPEGTDA